MSASSIMDKIAKLEEELLKDMNLRLISNSERKDFTFCRRLWFLKYAVGVEKTGNEKVGSSTGTLFHTAMDILWQGGTARDAVAAATAMGKGWLGSGNDDVVVDAIQRAQQTIKQYAHHYRETGIDGEVVAVEAEVQSKALHMKARVDKIVKRGDRYYFVDHKTTGSAVSGWEDANQYARQPQLYCLIGREMYGDKFDGIMMDIAYSKIGSAELFFTATGLSAAFKAKLPSTTYHEYLKACKGITITVKSGERKQVKYVDKHNVGERLKNRDAQGHFFKRVMLFYSDDVLDTFIKEDNEVTKLIVKDEHSLGEFKRGDMVSTMRTLWKHSHRFPRTYASCKSYGSRCELEHVCHSRMLEAQVKLHEDHEYGRYADTKQGMMDIPF